jgi:hypothetical protein
MSSGNFLPAQLEMEAFIVQAMRVQGYSMALHLGILDKLWTEYSVYV